MTPLDFEQMQVKEKDFESSLAVVTSIAVCFMSVVFAIVWAVIK